MFARKLLYLRQAMKRQWMKESDLKKFQFKKLKILIAYSYKYTRFYHKLWDSVGIKPDDIKTIEDIKKLPIITRPQIMENYSELITQDFHKNIFDEKIGHSGLTAGSSGGHSFRVIHNEAAWDYYEAVYLRALLNVGYKPWHKIAYYWYEPFVKKAYNQFKLMKKEYISCTLPFQEQIKILENLNPKIIYYFSSILYVLAKMIQDNSKINPNVIITHAELLSEKMRKKIGDVFNAPVYDEYGTQEFNRLAWECGERNGYHVDADSILLELVRNNEDVASGEFGNVVLTGLWNRSMPLIRYKIEDVGIPSSEKCNCGRGLPLIKSIEGRKNDLIVLPNGQFVSPKNIIDVMDSVDGLLTYQFNQLETNKFEINVIPNQKIEMDKLKSELQDRFKILLHPSASINVNEKDISPNKRGKLKLVNSFVERVL